MASQSHLELLLAIQVYGDAQDTLHQISLGTTGNVVLFNAESKATGKAHAVPGFLDGLLKIIGEHLDNQYTVWAHVTTNATGVAPTLTDSFGIASVTKFEAFESLQLDFTTDYDTATSHTPLAILLTTVGFAVNVGQSDDDMTFSFYDDTGTIIDINNLTVRCMAVGRRAATPPAAFPDPPARDPGGGGNGK